MRGVVLGYLMKNRPSCCAPTKYNGAKGRIENLVPGFKGPLCEGLKRDKTPCRNIAVTASKHCWQHGGAIQLEKRLKALNPKLQLVRTPGSVKRHYEASLRAADFRERENVP
jgi:putative hemolysin